MKTAKHMVRRMNQCELRCFSRGGGEEASVLVHRKTSRVVTVISLALLVALSDDKIRIHRLDLSYYTIYTNPNYIQRGQNERKGKA